MKSIANPTIPTGELDMKKYQCVVCGWVYDEVAGDPEHGIAPGTRWEDVPESWSCPDCGVAKADFEMVAV
jgi:rubredoxin